MFIFELNYYNLAYTIFFILSFFTSYYVILFTRLEQLFKKGSIWPIRITQVIIALIIAYFLATAIMSLINNTQF